MEFQTIWFNSILNYIRDIIKIGSSSTATNPRNISVILNSKKIICVPMSSSSTNHFRSLSITQTIFLHQQQYTVSKNSAWLFILFLYITLIVMWYDQPHEIPYQTGGTVRIDSIWVPSKMNDLQVANSELDQRRMSCLWMTFWRSWWCMMVARRYWWYWCWSDSERFCIMVEVVVMWPAIVTIMKGLPCWLYYPWHIQNLLLELC